MTAIRLAGVSHLVSDVSAVLELAWLSGTVLAATGYAFEREIEHDRHEPNARTRRR